MNFKKFFVILFSLSLFLFSANIYGDNENITIPLKDYNLLIEKLEKLEKRVETIEKENPNQTQIEDKIEKVEKNIKQVNKDIDSIYNTVDKVETKTLKDRINLSGELRTRVDNYKVNDNMRFDYKTYMKEYMNGVMQNQMMADPYYWTKYYKKETITNNNSWSNRLRLNLDAEITKNLKFTGKATMYKNWADSDRFVMYTDPNRSKTPSDTTIKLERAYVDWVIPNDIIPFSITFGRQPSSEGPPFEFKENKERLSTYPSLLFDGEADGIVFTFGLEKWTDIKNNAFRIAYGKGYQSDDDFNIYYDERGGLDDLNVFGLFFEGEIPTLPNSLFVLSYVRGFDFVDTPLNTSMNIGSMDLFGLHLQTQKFLNSNFNLFTSFGMDISHPNGEYMVSSPETMFLSGGLLDDNGKNSHTGYSIYTGVSYDIPFKPLNNPILGVEYNYGSKYWFSFTQGSTELFNKLATRGNAYDIYYIQPINKSLQLRTGFTYIDYNYSLSGWHIGEPTELNNILRNYYLLIDCKF